MDYRVLLALFVSLVLITGCMTSGTKTPPPKVYVTPCNVASKEVQLRVSGELNKDLLKEQLKSIYLDDFYSPSGTGMNKDYGVNCYWGNYVGESRDYYYCAGKYKAPELDETRVIRRFIWKEFKIGFKVEQHDVGIWVDSAGVLHQQGTAYYLTTKTVEAYCYVA